MSSIPAFPNSVRNTSFQFFPPGAMGYSPQALFDTSDPSATPYVFELQQRRILTLEEELRRTKDEVHILLLKLQEYENNQGKEQKKPQSRYWTPEEHKLFLDALEKYGPKDVKSISVYVGTRNPTQVRTHAQKYFLRLEREKTRGKDSKGSSDASSSTAKSGKKKRAANLELMDSRPKKVKEESSEETLVCDSQSSNLLQPNDTPLGSPGDSLPSSPQQSEFTPFQNNIFPPDHESFDPTGRTYFGSESLSSYISSVGTTTDRKSVV